MADALYRDPAYREAMRKWAAHMAHTGWTCRRCGLAIPAGDRAAWDLGHPAPFEPEHRTCNRSAGASDGNRARGMPSSRNWG